MSFILGGECGDEIEAGREDQFGEQSGDDCGDDSAGKWVCHPAAGGAGDEAEGGGGEKDVGGNDDQ